MQIIILQFCRLEISQESHWAETQMVAGLLCSSLDCREEYLSLHFSTSRHYLLALVYGTLHFQSSSLQSLPPESHLY